jgi:hypothetical protein
MNNLTPLICYLQDLAATFFAVACGVMWMMRGNSLASGQATALFSAHVARGLSFVALFSLAGFIAAGAMRASFGAEREVIFGFILLLPVCAGLGAWYALGRTMRRSKTGR